MKAKTDSFPLTVKAGSTAVKIYRDSKPSGDYFRVVYHLGGKRHGVIRLGVEPVLHPMRL